MSSEGSALTEQTKVLYVNNLNDKLHIENVLKRQLYRLFSQYGKVEEVIAFKGLKGRGQAWVVYQEVNAAAAALRAKQGFNFYEKPLKIAFAKINPSKTMTIKAKVDAGKVAAAASKKRKSAEVETDEKSSSSQMSKKAHA
jgi:RNA recognition motif-containing protein